MGPGASFPFTAPIPADIQINIDPAEEGALMTDYEPIQITYFRVVVRSVRLRQYVWGR